MKKRLFLLVFASWLLSIYQISAQVGIGTSTPNPKAVLELKSPGNNQGFLVPRLTTAERTAMTASLTATEKGLLVFDSNDNKFYYWSGTVWIVIEDSVGTGTVTSVATGAGLTGGPITVTGTISLADNGVTTAKLADGSVTSTKIADGAVATTDLADASVTTAKIGNTQITDAKIASGISVSKLSPSTTNGQVLTTVGSATQWATPNAGTVTNIATGTGLTGGPITATGTIAIASNGVTATELRSDAATDANRAVTRDHIRDNAINSAKVADGSLVAADLGTGSVTDVKIADVGPNKITAGGATNGQVLKWNGTNWVPQADNNSGGTVTSVSAGTGLSTGASPITSSGVISLTNTGVTAGTYGNATQVPAITVDAQGRISGVTATNITGVAPGGGASGDLAGTYPGPTISSSAGNNIVTAVNNAATSGTINTNRLNTAVVLESESPAAGDISGSYGAGFQIGSGTVTTTEIADGTVSTADIGNTQVTDAKIANVAASKILQGSANTNQVLKWNGTAWTPQADADTDAQDLSLSGNTLSLTNDGTTVSLAAFLDNTDAQNLSLGTKTGTLQPINISGGTGVTIDVADNDNNATNEIQDLSINTSTNVLSLSGDATTVSLAGYLDNTDAQNLTYTPATATLAISGGNSVTISGTTPAGTATGDLNGTYPNPTVDGLQGRPVTATAPAAGQVLEWNGTAWAPGTDDVGSGGGVTGSGSVGQITYWTGTSSVNGDNNLFWDNKNSTFGIGTSAPEANLHALGSQAVSIDVITGTSSYTVDAKNYVIVTGSEVSELLLPDADAIVGRVLIIRHTDAKALTIRAANGKDTIDGTSNLQLQVGDGQQYAVTLISAGGGRWISIGNARR